MAKQTINVGTAVNSGGGDPLRTAMIKINENFTEVYADIAAIPGYISLADLKTEVAASADFAAFKIRIAAL